jgi:hypothetical protein
MDIAAWLEGLGLGQYEQAFRDNEIDERVLPSLTAEDLKDLGVKLVGHRRRLLDAIAALGVTAHVKAATERTDDVAPRSDAERRQLTVMGYISPAPWFERSPRHWGGVVDAPSHHPPGDGM